MSTAETNSSLFNWVGAEGFHALVALLPGEGDATTLMGQIVSK